MDARKQAIYLDHIGVINVDNSDVFDATVVEPWQIEWALDEVDYDEGHGFFGDEVIRRELNKSVVIVGNCAPDLLYALEDIANERNLRIYALTNLHPRRPE